MKKIFLKFLIACCFFLIVFWVNQTYADDPCEWASCGATTTWEDSWPKTIKLTVTEKVPWANCEPIEGDGELTSKYECTVAIGWQSVMIMLGKMIRFMTTLAIIWAVLFIVISGIQLSMGWLDWNAKSAAKERVFKLLGWVVLLLLSGPLLTLIAPWIYR